MESLSPTNQPTRSPVWQLVVRKPYDASGMSEFAFWLKKNTLNYLVGEHPEDDDVKTTHCHILIEGLKVSDEGLRKCLKRCDISGAEYSIMKKTLKTRLAYDKDHLATYIIKGNQEHVKSSSCYDAQIKTWADAWVHHEKPVARAESEPGQAVVKKKPNTVYQDCDEIIDTIPNWSTRDPTIVERTQVVAAIIAWANNKRKALHSVQVMNYYDVIMCQAVPEYYKTLCVDLINRRHK